MPLFPEQTTFRRAQTDTPTTLTVYFSVDSTDAIGRTVDGPWDCATVTLTEEELASTAGIVARARQAYCDKVNTPPVVPNG